MMAKRAACLFAWLALASPLLAAPDAELAAARAAYWQHPYQPQAINRLALLLASRGDASTAALLLERALRIAPGREDIRDNLARLRAGQRRVASAPTYAAEPPAVSKAAPTAASAPLAEEGKPLPPPWPLPSEPPAVW
ncbi:hypothetical protein [Chromobacterium paludis]|uniref:Uncharacterized protein n=1 Tax=Chromobacterium paludis TaxID=2605945 RepID=A0A5C1DE89_9NEIS|nr:hypothetical protein [Chromobacterium paludis]QEL55085.1 hypothetical protein FYK34_05640 [Chromobacterium paludis]